MGYSDSPRKTLSFYKEVLLLVKNLSQQEIINTINEKEFSEVFLFDKDFEALLGGITKNSSGHIVGAKATILKFFGQIDIDALTEDEIKFNTNFGPPVSSHYMICTP